MFSHLFFTDFKTLLGLEQELSRSSGSQLDIFRSRKIPILKSVPGYIQPKALLRKENMAGGVDAEIYYPQHDYWARSIWQCYGIGFT